MEYFHHNKLQEVLTNGFNLDIGKSIGEGFEMVKKEIGLFIAATLISGLIIGMVSMVGSIIQFIDPLNPTFRIIGQLVNQFSIQFISPPLMAGFYIAANKVYNNEVLDFGDFFRGFEHYKELVTQGLIYAAISLIAVIPMLFIFYSMGLFDPLNPPNFQGSTIALFVIAFIFIFIFYMYIFASYLFASLFVIFGNMKAWEAMEASRQVVSKNFWIVLGFAIVIGLIGMLGYIACCLGLLVSIPVVLCSIFVAFKDIMDFDGFRSGSGDANDIMDHLVD